jgi:hypothetical protein
VVEAGELEEPGDRCKWREGFDVERLEGFECGMGLTEEGDLEGRVGGGSGGAHRGPAGDGVGLRRWLGNLSQARSASDCDRDGSGSCRSRMPEDDRSSWCRLPATRLVRAIGDRCEGEWPEAGHSLRTALPPSAVRSPAGSGLCALRVHQSGWCGSSWAKIQSLRRHPPIQCLILITVERRLRRPPRCCRAWNGT